MKRYQKYLSTMLCIIGIIILTLDSKNCIAACQEAILLCIQVLIPSLFPFFVLSNYISSAIDPNRLLNFEKILRIPQGAGLVFLLGLLGGYPSGAQLISDQYRKNQISKDSAHTLLQFCNNAGPAFILGMSAALFSSPVTGWILWLIHITAAILTGLVLYSKDKSQVLYAKRSSKTLSDALKSSIRTMSYICGWVILFRTILSAICERLNPAIPCWIQALISGLTELSNGIISLQMIDSEAIRFVMFSIFIGFGGICVVMQTSNITEGLDIKYYLQGKAMQCAFSILLSVPTSFLIFKQHITVSVAILLITASIFWIGLFSILNKRKKCCNISPKKLLSRV